VEPTQRHTRCTSGRRVPTADQATDGTQAITGETPSRGPMTHSTIASLAALVLVATSACAPEDMLDDVGDIAADDQDQVSEPPDSANVETIGALPAQQLTVRDAAFSACTTTIVRGLSEQLVDEMECLQPGIMADIAGISNIGLGPAAFPFLQRSAAGGLERAAREGYISLNSTLRTTAQQYVLHTWYRNGLCRNVVFIAAPPGRSNHESGLAVDVGNYSSRRGSLERAGFRWLGANDPVHFDYVLGGTDLRSVSVLAFQRLWNRNRPDAPIPEDGAFGPITDRALADSPAQGFAGGTTCGGSLPAPGVAIEVYWSRGTNGVYELRALAPETVSRVEYVVDGFIIGSADRGDGSNFPTSYEFSNDGIGRRFEVRGFDEEDQRVGTGVGSIDVTPDVAVSIRQMGQGLYEISLERAPADVASIEVRADQYLLTDGVSGTSRSERLAVRSTFSQLGTRTFRVTTFNADGTERGTLTRSFTLR